MKSDVLQSLKGKIIDFRLRPAVGAYQVFFTPKVVEGVNRTLGNPVPPSYNVSVSGVSEDAILQAVFAEMDSVGVRLGVMNGRHSPNRAIPVHIEDTDLVDLRNKSKGRLQALAGINLDKPNDEINAGLETAVKELGIVGVCIEPGLARTPLHADDQRLFPIYQKVADLGVPLQFMTGPFAGPDISYTEPVRFERVARAFPKMPVIMGHGCYPYVAEAVSLTYKSEVMGMSDVYLSPDVYMFAPGGLAYSEGINAIPNRFLFGSAYSFCGVDRAVLRTLELPIREDALPAYMYQNAERLLGV